MLALSMSNAHITSLASSDANDMILYFSAHLGQSEIYTGIIYINFYIRRHDFCLWIKHCDKYRLYLRREFSSGKTKKATSINSWVFCWINMYFIIWENGRRGFPGFIFIFLQLFKAGLAFPGFRSARQKSQNAPSS